MKNENTNFKSKFSNLKSKKRPPHPCFLFMVKIVNNEHKSIYG